MSMKIAAHRGFWLHANQKNSLAAFRRALGLGFGIETDVRDSTGTLVITHDMPRGGEPTLDNFLALCARYPEARPLALNIKADGLQLPLQSALQRHKIKDAFVFDMAIPDTLGYFGQSIPTYTRCSEYEQPPPLLELASGVWLDAFESDWYEASTITAWLEAGKEVCIVSPELHNRPYRALWQRLKDWGLHLYAGLTLCTDFPTEAKDTFYGN